MTRRKATYHLNLGKMYNLFYYYGEMRLMCTFRDYSDCKKALQALKKKYPDNIVKMSSVTTINSFDEWQDKFGGEVHAFEEAKRHKEWASKL